MENLADNSDHAAQLADLRERGEVALAEFFQKHNVQLERMVSFRLDRRLYGRVDPADILQEAYVEAAKRIDSYLADPQVSMYIWIRGLTWQTLLLTHRKHLDVQKRDARQEQSLAKQASGDNTATSIASRLAGSFTSPSQGAMREEQHDKLQSTLDQMDPTDREVLALRHFEQLSNKEVSELLGISKTAASNRYMRALARMKTIMEGLVEDE